MSEPIAIVRTFEELHAALRARCEALRTRHEDIDHFGGLPDGYASKILAPRPIRRMGVRTLGPIISALGLMIVLVEDREMLDQLARRTPRKSARPEHANAAMRTRKKHKWRGNSAWGRAMRMRGLANMSPAQIKKSARKAARIRWGKKKPGETAHGQPKDPAKKEPAIPDLSAGNCG